MTRETLFDEAWERWRRGVTGALSPTFGDDADRVRQALTTVGALDPADGLISREWALGLLTGDEERVRLLTERGLSDGTVRDLIALIERHPLPAAGG